MRTETPDRSPVPPDWIRALPKVLLHDHLDGGVRPATVIDLAAEAGVALPVRGPRLLAEWFADNANSGSLASYLRGFRYTYGLMRTAAAVERVAHEAVEDLAADGVAYAELRIAPQLHTTAGLTMLGTLKAAAAGLRAGAISVKAAGGDTDVRLIACVERDLPIDDSAMDAFITAWEQGLIVGVDLVGPELGHPAAAHAEQFERAYRAGVPATIHAGEADGTVSIRQAIELLHARRIGHGVSLGGEVPEDAPPASGSVGELVRDRGITVECCPTSNVHTGGAASVGEHPILRMARCGIRATVNTDNRLMSRTSVSQETALLATALGAGPDEIRAFHVRAAEAAFLPSDERRRLTARIVQFNNGKDVTQP
ncbi:adenosine deaminase [Actinomadura pelletieri DSM 43383]|uniref:adenosine deaminase n=1 Tax=Actinomadura pelletieri DSM 43383 TaxID=1120940 RepID=A0A495QXC9_9ACTN|nr:adenosine deaminase [Actinomadura pelletieri]RKS78763.1 adenosine deaminase [Actinomadura pelletieri DSM 43383]